MKLILKLILLQVAIQTSVAHGETITHRIQPLEDAAMYLAKISQEADSLTTSENANQVQDLKALISDLTRRSLLTSFAPLDKVFKDEGYVLKLKGTNNLNRVFELSKSMSHNSLQREAQQFIKQGWLGVAMSVDQDHFNTKSLLQLSEKVAPALSSNDLEEIRTIAYARRSIVQDIQQEVDQTLGCINYYSEAIPRMGLTALQVSSKGEYEWSSAELFKVYQIRSITELDLYSNQQKRMAVIRNIETLIDALSNYGYRCVNYRVVKFWSDELSKF